MFEDGKGNSNGYVIVNALKNENPIIEYSDASENFINVATDQAVSLAENSTGSSAIENETKILYLDNLNYLAEIKLENDESHLYDITSPIPKVS